MVDTLFPKQSHAQQPQGNGWQQRGNQINECAHMKVAVKRTAGAGGNAGRPRRKNGRPN